MSSLENVPGITGAMIHRLLKFRAGAAVADKYQA
jgi:hypothetical protein